MKGYSNFPCHILDDSDLHEGKESGLEMETTGQATDTDIGQAN